MCSLSSQRVRESLEEDLRAMDPAEINSGLPSPRLPSPVVTPQPRKLNEAVYELYSPSANSNLEIVFFHGLQLPDYYQAYIEAWVSAKGDECWPQTWLPRDFPRARILSVSYDSSAIKGAKQGNMDMEATGESLLDSVIRQAGVGQTNPVILVGHSLGGLVIKQICLKAESIYNSKPSEVHLQKFLSNLRGIFFYATPHHGSRLASMAAYLPWYPSSLLKYLTFLNKETESLNDNFCELRRKYQWKATGLGEAREVFLPGLSRGLIVVPEESARCDMDYFAQLGEDHVTICKPKGRSCSSYRHFIAFILSIVGKVHRCQGVPLHAAGLHSQVEQVKELLDESPLVAIVGMAGIGLTTIARAVFNTISYDFEYTCFIDSVKACSKYEKLEARILANLYHHGRKLKNCEGDWNIVKGKRVLLIMDDVNSRDQVRPVLDAGSFTSDSRVIVTSHELGNLRLLEFNIYFARSLNDQAAKKVFCHNAFRQRNVPTELSNLKGFVQQVVENCNGLPLVLELIGCCLYRPKYEEYEEDVWKDCINSLKYAEALESSAESKLLRKLRFIYDRLGSHEQAMFLDVATIFYGWPVKKIQAAWCTCWKHSETGWSNLVGRGLVKHVSIPLLQNDVAYMYASLKDLGRSIAVETQSRAYDYRHEDIMHQLLGEGKENVQLKGLMLSRWRKAWGPNLNISSLSRMPDLRFLMLKNIPVIGSCGNLPKQLSLLQWRILGASTQELNGLSHLAKVAVLELDARSQMYKGNLDDIARGLGNLVELRVLKFEGDFVQLPDDFGNLQYLQHFTLSSGSRLTSLPQSFGYLSSLQELVISNTGLATLPDSFGHLSSLKKLRLECFHLSVLPDSFGKLSSLETLHLFCCEEIQRLPESFGNLSALQLLEINVCPKLEELPASFGRLDALKKLRILYCSNLNWPSLFGPLPSLRKLEITGLGRLPESLGQLLSLTKLRLSDVDAKHLPQSFRQLTYLQLLQIQMCPCIAAWHLELYKMGWMGFHQRILQETQNSMLELFVYLRRGYKGLEPENLQQTANNIFTRQFPHPSRWGWPKAMEVGPVLRRPDVNLFYGRSLSQILRA